ncbi:MAG: hypothetical protein ABSE25_03430 [Syntrophorhabdales bacterium]|jgi:hypothetical protein
MRKPKIAESDKTLAGLDKFHLTALTLGNVDRILKEYTDAIDELGSSIVGKTGYLSLRLLNARRSRWDLTLVSLCSRPLTE